MADRTRYTANLVSTSNLYVDTNTDQLGIGTTNPISKLQVVGNTNITGILTATGGFNLGISSAGTSITSGPITTLNFIGAGNTFAINGTTVDISIAGGGGGGASVSISTVAPASPNAGDLWYSSILGRTFIYYNDEDSSQWVDSSPFNIPEPASTPSKTVTSFTATEGQTTFAVSYTLGYVDVYLNGVRLNSSEFIEDNGSAIILVESTSLGDVLDIIEYKIGIGATGPTGPSGPLSGVTSITTDAIHYPLFVTGTGDVNPYVSVASSYFSFNPSTGTLIVNQMSVVGVSTAKDFNSTSDINLKDTITKIEDPIEKVLQLNGVSFYWKDTTEQSAGIIAQDVEKVMPEIVRDNNGNKSVNYNGLIGLLVEAVKEQQKQINTLKTEIENLKK